jgi:hypothetical protein
MGCHLLPLSNVLYRRHEDNFFLWALQLLFDRYFTFCHSFTAKPCIKWQWMNGKYCSWLLETVSTALICHSWTFVKWDFLKQSRPVNHLWNCFISLLITVININDCIVSKSFNFLPDSSTLFKMRIRPFLQILLHKNSKV